MPRKAKSKTVKIDEKIQQSEHVRSVYKDPGIYSKTTLTLAAGEYKWTEHDKALLRECRGFIIVDDAHPAPEYVEAPWDHIITEAENDARRVLEHPKTDDDWKEEARQVLHFAACVRSDLKMGEGWRESALRDLAEAESLSSATPDPKVLDAIDKRVWTVSSLDAYVAILESSRRFVFNATYHFAHFVERMHVRAYEGAARIGKEKGGAIQWRGQWISVSAAERLILEALVLANEVSLHDLVQHAWGTPYHASRRATYDKAFSRLNGKILSANSTLQLHVRGNRVIVE